MKKLYFSLLCALSLGLSQGQVVQNETVTNCTSNSRSIYATLTAGKVLVIASEGFDCSVCRSKASGLQAWASQNSSSIDVWGAMTFTYSSNTPNCSDVNDWKSTYSWNNIFMFIDSGRKWFGAGTPQYFVYNPKDSSLAYQGFSEVTARSTAENLANNSIGIQERVVAAPFYVNQGDGFIQLNNLPLTSLQCQLFDLTGKVIKAQVLNGNGETQKISTADMKNGIYLIKVKGANGFEAVKKVLIR